MSSQGKELGGQAEKVVQEPFIIRGHHLEIYKELIKWDQSGNDVTSWLARSVRRNNERMGAFYKMDIVADIVGRNETDADAYEKRLGGVLQRFKGLPDGDRVHILQRSDDICRACISGKHCGYYRIARADSSYMREFIEEANELGLESDIQRTLEDVDFTDEHTKSVMRIETSAGTVKRVLKQQLKNYY